MISIESLNRRAFLKTGTRYAMLASLGGLAVAGELKRRRLASDPNCIRLWTCADCAEFGGCTQPKAATFQQSQERGQKGIIQTRPQGRFGRKTPRKKSL